LCANIALRILPCPHFRNPLNRNDVILNRALGEEVQQWLHIGEVLMGARNSYCGVFVGRISVGKSKTINSIVGRNVSNSAQGVTQTSFVVCDELILNRPVKLIDALGIFNPDKTNEEILTQLKCYS
jgi:ribosome biogenesis GTPase A